MAGSLEQIFDKVLAETRSIAIALQSYKKVVEDIGQTDKTAKADYEKVGFGEIDKRLDAMKTIAITAAKLR